MRRIAFTLVGVAALVLCGSQAAMAHGYYGHHGYHSPVARSFYPRYATPGFVGGYGAGYGGYGVGYGAGYGCGTGYAGYATPYGYGYPQAGFGLSAPNFSLFVR